MSRIFKSGQLVTLIDWCNTPVELCSESNPRANINSRVIGRLSPHGVAIIIFVGRSDSSSVYLLGSDGGGWAESAFLKAITN